jgi:hypothetical protein
MQGKLSLVFAVFVLLVVFLVAWYSSSVPAFTEAVRNSSKVTFYEGIPRHREPEKKPVFVLHGESFYQGDLTLPESNRKLILELLQDPATFQPLTSGEHKCGGFHADYAVEFLCDGQKYQALLCFGCDEVKLYGPGIERHDDLSRTAIDKLRELFNYKGK